MANTIVSLSGPDLSIESTAGRYARKPLPSVFDGWTQLRVCILMNMVDTSANIGGTPRFGFGLCAGTTNIPGDASVTHACGIMSNSATWTRSTAVVRYAVNMYPFTHVGTTMSFGSLMGNVFVQTAAHSAYFIDITKGSPNYSFRLFAPNSAGGAPCDVPTFKTQSVLASPALTNYFHMAAVTVPVDEATNGTFDSMWFWWNQASPVMTNKIIRVVRLA